MISGFATPTVALRLESMCASLGEVTREKQLNLLT